LAKYLEYTTFRYWHDVRIKSGQYMRNVPYWLNIVSIWLCYYRDCTRHVPDVPERTTTTSASLSNGLGCETVFLLNCARRTYRWTRSETNWRHFVQCVTVDMAHLFCCIVRSWRSIEMAE